MWGWIISLSSLSLVGWYWWQKSAKVKMAKILMERFLASHHTPGIQFHPEQSYATIEYKTGTHKHKLYLPLKVKQRRHPRIVHARVYLVREKGAQDITHQPGIPYFLSAREMGGIGTKIVYEDEDVYLGPDEIPVLQES